MGSSIAPRPAPATGPIRRPGGAPGVEILFADEWLIVAAKPAGMRAASGAERKSSLQSLLERQLNTRLFAVTEIDDHASGIVVFATSADARREVRKQVSPRSARLIEYALVEGEKSISGPEAQLASPQSADTDAAASDDGADAALAETGSTPPASDDADGLDGAEDGDPSDAEPATTPRAQGSIATGTIRAMLVLTARGVIEVASNDPRQRRAGLDRPDEPLPATDAMPSITHYRVEATGNGATLLRLRLETDHREQARAHLAHLGHPIVGDRAHSARDKALGARLGRLGLHRSTLRFQHPHTGEHINIECPPPASFWLAVGADPPASASRDRQRDAAGPAAEAQVAPAKPDAAAAPAKRAERQPTAAVEPEQSWDHVAGWYAELVGSRRSDHHDQVVHPGVLELLGPVDGLSVLDVACGSGELCGLLAERGARAIGVDSSPLLVAEAMDRVQDARFLIGDARAISLRVLGDDDDAPAEPFDAATCVLALMNIEPLEPVLSGVASCLLPGGTFVLVVLHPAFRQPGRTDWLWRDDRELGQRQLRAVAGYLSSHRREIVMNPGEVASGGRAVTTTTHTRPISAYVRALVQSGFMIDALEEWPSLRVSEPGPRAEAENLARAEIPMFLAIRAVRQDDSEAAPEA